jgi:hypothetical protein
MNHFANPSFWTCYYQLPEAIQKLADRNLNSLKKTHVILHYIKKKWGDIGLSGLGNIIERLLWKLRKDCCGFGLGHMQNMTEW